MPSKTIQSRYRHVASTRGWRACPLASAALMCERGEQCVYLVFLNAVFATHGSGEFYRASYQASYQAGYRAMLGAFIPLYTHRLFNASVLHEPEWPEHATKDLSDDHFDYEEGGIEPPRCWPRPRRGLCCS